MPKLEVIPRWNAEINEIASGDLAVGGPTGNVNAASKQLAESLFWLRWFVNNTSEALQGQIDSIGGGNIPYSTYAAMVEDKASITKKMVLEVMNDPDPLKNGRYSYDGTTFILSSSDSKAVIDKAVTDAKTRVDAAIEASTVDGSLVTDALIATTGGVSQLTINNGIASLAAMLALPNKFDGMVIKTKAYYAGGLSGGNTYRYNSARALDNDYGTVINGWELVDKKEVYPIDFGVLPDIANADNDARLESFLLSDLKLRLDIKTYKFTAFKSIAIVKPMRLRGVGLSLSRIDNIQLLFTTSDSDVRDVFLATLSNNYTIYIASGDSNTFTRVKAYHNFDGFCIYSTTGNPRNNRFKDCISEKSGRVGFTADNKATSTYFDNCVAIDCRQGFHAEASIDTHITNATTDGCGLLSSIASGENLSYEGSLRSYAVHGLYVKGFKNINPKGRCQWQHGGNSDIKSSNLVFEDMEGVGAMILDNEAGTTTNLTVKNADDFAIYSQSALQKVDGIISIEGVTGTYETALQTNADIITLKNADLGRVLLETKKAGSTMILDNVRMSQTRFNLFTADNIYIKNGLTSNQLSQADPEWYQGIRFDLTNTKTFVADKIEIMGAGGGIHLSFVKPTGMLDTGYLGSYVAKIAAGISLNSLDNIGTSVFSKLGIGIKLHKTIYQDSIPDFGDWKIGDEVRKFTIGVDLTYGWVCTAAGIPLYAQWQPLKYVTTP